MTLLRPVVAAACVAIFFPVLCLGWGWRPTPAQEAARLQCLNLFNEHHLRCAQDAMKCYCSECPASVRCGGSELSPKGCQKFLLKKCLYEQGLCRQLCDYEFEACDNPDER